MPADPTTIRWAQLEVAASSLKALFSGPSLTVPTSGGRDAWLALVSSSSLQPLCNQEGVNLAPSHARVRVGILANNTSSCTSPDSWLGIGGGPLEAVCGFPATAVTTGNAATCPTPESRHANIAAYGFLLVR